MMKYNCFIFAMFVVAILSGVGEIYGLAVLLLLFKPIFFGGAGILDTETYEDAKRRELKNTSELFKKLEK
jgi:hypothetical protein